jgi:hypothetical protein
MKTTEQPALLKLPRGVLPTLRKRDPRLAWLIERVGPFAMPAPTPRTHLEALSRSIVYQQLSGKAAATIYGRFRALWDSADFPVATADPGLSFRAAAWLWFFGAEGRVSARSVSKAGRRSAVSGADRDSRR